jgi:putative ABC transport system permease protein
MPDWKAEIRQRLANSKLPPAREAEIVEELAQDLDDRFEHALASGATKDEAYQAVMRELAESDLLARELRLVHPPAPQESVVLGTQRRINMLADLWQDLRYGVRTLVRNPGFTAIAVLALALGIGANSAIFSVVNTVLLQPLPYKDSDRLVMVWEDDTAGGFPKDTPAVGNYIDWRDQNQVFEGMAAMANLSFNLTGIGDPEQIEGRLVSANLFSLLGVQPQLGRTFLAEEDQPGRNNVVIMSHGLWQRRFNSNPDVIGKILTLNGQSAQVVGVMPPHFQFPTREDELWAPIAFTPQQLTNRNRHYLQVVARLKPGISLQQASAEMNTIAVRAQQQFPDSNNQLGVAIVTLREHLVGDIKPALFVLLAAVGFVLLIACANVANLLLARAAVRQKEIVIRVALGANRFRLVRQVLTESLLLAAVGGGLGLLLAVYGVSVLKSFIPENIAQAQTVAIDGKVLLFTFGVSMVTGLIFGLIPALQASNFNLNETLKEGGRDSGAGTRGNRIRSLLVIGEVAISLILLVGAGLLINSFLRLRGVDAGYRTDNLLTMRIVLPDLKYREHAARTAFYTDVINRVEALPGVQSASVVNWIPLVRQGDSIGFSIAGVPDAGPGQRPTVMTRVVDPKYLQTMSIPLLQGRNFESQDKLESPGVAIINETMARRFWPNQDPTGKRITPGRYTSTDPNDWITIIGVAKDVRQVDLAVEPKPQMYLTYIQADFFAPRHLIVKTSVEPKSLASVVRKTVWEVDKDQPVSNILTMDEVLSESIARQRFSMLLLGVFAAVALVLAAVGIYGVMSYSVAQRRNEIGIRMALGAQKSDVLKLTVGHGLKLVLIGVGCGLAGAFMLTRLMSSLLFGVRATDPTTFVAISVILVGVALLASYIPARRATKVDPLVALRYE